jgi:geranylgeranyl diphosphate synthase type II
LRQWTKIESVKDIFNNSASKANQDAIQEYTFKAFETLEK